MAKRLKRLKQGVIIENRMRMWNESKIWRKMAKVLKAAARNDRFEGLRRLREEANAIALEYVNELLKDFGMNVKSLEELPVRTSETENRRIPAFDSSDEVMEVFVNKALARYSLPMIAQEEEEEEEEEVAEKSASAESGESKSEPELASQSEDMTDSDVAVEIVQGMLDQPMPQRQTPVRKPVEEPEKGDELDEAFTDEDARETVRTMNFRVALMSFTRPRIRQVSTITEKDIQLYVNNKSVFDIVDSVFMGIQLPITTNLVSDETLWEIVKDDVFDSVEEFQDLDVAGLAIYERIDIQRFANEKEADAVIDWLYDELRLPICENDVDDEAVIEIAEDDLFDTFQEVTDNRGTVDMLDIFEKKDIQLFVNDRMADEMLEDLYSTLRLPIEPNVASPETLREIVEKSYDDLLPPFSQVNCQPISDFTRKIILDSDVINNTVAAIMRSEVDDMPIISNDVTQQALDDILADDEFGDIFELFELEECDSIERYCFKEPCVYANDRFTESLADVMLRRVDLPIVPNVVTEQAVDEILDFYDFSDVAEIGTLGLACLSVPPKDLQLYVNSRETDKVTQMIFARIQLPIVPNTVDDAAIAEIADDDLVESIIDVIDDDYSALERLQFKDIQFYVNEITTNEMIDGILHEVQLPIGPNVVTQRAIDEILSEDYGDVVPPFGDLCVDPLREVHPVERRVDYSFPFDAMNEQFLSVILDDLPIGPNVCTDATAEEISACIGEVEFYSYDTSAARALQEYEAPAEVFELVDDVVDRLMWRILQRDVLPHMPMTEDAVVEDDELEEIVDDVLDEPSLFGGVADFASMVDPLRGLPCTEIPSYIAPEDVVEQLLWNDVLPFMPVVAKGRPIRNYRDTIDAIVLDNYAQGHVSGDENSRSDDDDHDYPFLMVSKPSPDRKSSSPPVNKP